MARKIITDWLNKHCSKKRQKELDRESKQRFKEFIKNKKKTTS